MRRAILVTDMEKTMHNSEDKDIGIEIWTDGFDYKDYDVYCDHCTKDVLHRMETPQGVQYCACFHCGWNDKADMEALNGSSKETNESSPAQG